MFHLLDIIVKFKIISLHLVTIYSNFIDYRNIYNCWIYTLKQFPDDFLNKFEFLSEYRNSLAQPYRERYRHVAFVQYYTRN